MQATFTIETSVVQASTPVSITASHRAIERTATLTVSPPVGNYVASVSVTPAFVVGGRTASGTVTLAAPSADKGGTDVMLTSSDPAVLAVPATVRVKPKELTAPFTVATTALTAPREVIVRAVYGGVTTSARVIVAPENAVTISTFTIAPSSIASGATATATVTLSGPAPFGGATVAIEPQRRNIVIVPASVVVPEGAVAASFPVTGDTVHGKKERVVDIAAMYNGITLTTPVSVRPPVSAMEDTPASIQCASAALAPCLTAAATAPITTFAATDYARSYSFYTPELNLMAETEETTLPAPRIAYEYIWFAGQPLAQVNRSTGELAYYFNDHLGTPLLQTDASATVVWRAEHEPYGVVHSFRAGTDKYQPLRFPGQEAGDSELAYNIFRWYRDGWGRYTQADPIGLEGGSNLYFYAGDEPVGSVDPLGLAYFAKRNLARKKYPTWFAPCSNPIDNFLDTELAHEQVFFEDGKEPDNIGFFSDNGGTFKRDTHAGYRCRSGNYDDCIMRKAVAAVGAVGPYCLLGKPGAVDKMNCQDWATIVRKKYSELMKDPKVKHECCSSQRAKP